MKIPKFILVGTSCMAVFASSWFITGKIIDHIEKKHVVKPQSMATVEVSDYDILDAFIAIKKVEKIANLDYKTVIKELKTPLETFVYCTKVLDYKADLKVYGKKDYSASFKHIHKNKEDDCDGGALAAAAILSDDGFPAYLAELWTPGKKTSHRVFVYKTTKGKYGSIGINKSDYTFNCDSLEQLRKRIIEESGNLFERITIVNLGKKFPDFIDNDKNNDMNMRH